MAGDRCCTMILSLWLAVCFLLPSSAKERDYLPPPANLTFGMNGMFCLLLQWNPYENTANCSIRYNKSISSNRRGHPPQERGKHPIYAAEVEKVDLNEEIVFKVSAECNNTNIISENTSLAIRLATGDPNTSVRNLRCVWYYSDHVHCTWQPGPDAPPHVNYTLLYWTSDELSCTHVKFSQCKQFPDLLTTGTPCYNYTYEDGIPNGCRFKYQKNIISLSKLGIAVSDWSRKVRPYFYSVSANNIAKLKPPVLEYAYRTANDCIHISWKDMEAHTDLLHEVLITKSNSESQDSYKDILGVSKVIPNALPDVTYTVKVRVRLPRYATATNDMNSLWSDWSEEWTLQGENRVRNLSILLLLLIASIIIAAVILLVFMKRLKILIFPRIPDPGKVLSNDLQQWLKNGRTAYNEPRKEEICPVSMLETPLTSPPVE